MAMINNKHWWYFQVAILFTKIKWIESKFYTAPCIGRYPKFAVSLTFFLADSHLHCFAAAAYELWIFIFLLRVSKEQHPRLTRRVKAWGKAETTQVHLDAKSVSFFIPKGQWPTCSGLKMMFDSSLERYWCKLFRIIKDYGPKNLPQGSWGPSKSSLKVVISKKLHWGSIPSIP